MWPLVPSFWKTYSPVGRVYEKPIRDMEELKGKWDELPQERVDRTIDQFRLRLWQVIKAEGEHIEHFM